jgi:DNA-directed RNA polymerase subunit beta'
VIIGKLIPAATGLRRYRSIDIGPTEPITPEAYQQDVLLQQALEEIDADGGSLGFDGDLDAGLESTPEPRDLPELDD